MSQRKNPVKRIDIQVERDISYMEFLKVIEEMEKDEMILNYGEGCFYLSHEKIDRQSINDKEEIQEYIERIEKLDFEERIVLLQILIDLPLEKAKSTNLPTLGKKGETFFLKALSQELLVLNEDNYLLSSSIKDRDLFATLAARWCWNARQYVINTINYDNISIPPSVIQARGKKPLFYAIVEYLCCFGLIKPFVEGIDYMNLKSATDYSLDMVVELSQSQYLKQNAIERIKKEESKRREVRIIRDTEEDSEEGEEDSEEGEEDLEAEEDIRQRDSLESSPDTKKNPFFSLKLAFLKINEKIKMISFMKIIKDLGYFDKENSAWKGAPLSEDEIKFNKNKFKEFGENNLQIALGSNKLKIRPLSDTEIKVFGHYNRAPIELMLVIRDGLVLVGETDRILYTLYKRGWLTGRRNPLRRKLHLAIPIEGTEYNITVSKDGLFFKEVPVSETIASILKQMAIFIVKFREKIISIYEEITLGED